jgi:hypothetical protein
LHVVSTDPTHGHVEVGRILIEHGADTATQDNREMTLLNVDSRNGHRKLHAYEHGADVAARNQGRRAPSWAPFFWVSIFSRRICLEIDASSSTAGPTQQLGAISDGWHFIGRQLLDV